MCLAILNILLYEQESICDCWSCQGLLQQTETWRQNDLWPDNCIDLLSTSADALCRVRVSIFSYYCIRMLLSHIEALFPSLLLNLLPVTDGLKLYMKAEGQDLDKYISWK